MTSLSNEALNLVEEELKSLRAKVATLTVERNTWNNSFHGANVERIKLKDQCERFLEEKEAWRNNSQALAGALNLALSDVVRYVARDKGTEAAIILPFCEDGLEAHRALVEKYK